MKYLKTPLKYLGAMAVLVVMFFSLFYLQGCSSLESKVKASIKSNTISISTTLRSFKL